MTNEVSWGPSQNHFLALPLVEFRGMTKTLDPGQPARRLLWQCVKRCYKLDWGSGHGHVEEQVRTHFEVGRAASL